MNFKKGKWAKKIIELQHEDGSWGYFHSLSNPTPTQPMTTEQALRRLEVLGFTIEDKPVKKAVKYMNDCLTGKNKTPDHEEKVHNWKIFTGLILSAWVRVFTDENKAANETAEKWSEIINHSFSKKRYDHNLYISKYEDVFKVKTNPKAGRLIDFVNFYPVSLLANSLDKSIEPYFFKYILQHEAGIYYIYDTKLCVTPNEFQSKNASRYIRALELMARFKNPECKKQLRFAVKWLKKNEIIKGRWDMGAVSKDRINFPLSDSWRTDDTRIADCTYRISRLLNNIEN